MISVVSHISYKLKNGISSKKSDWMKKASRNTAISHNDLNPFTVSHY